MTHNTIEASLTGFKKFGGEYIEDVAKYVQDYISTRPDYIVAVGCDSQQLRKSTCYVVAVVMFSPAQKNGAHVVFKREHVPKIRTHKGKEEIINRGGGKPVDQFDAWRDMSPRLFGEVDRVAAYCDVMQDALESIGYELPIRKKEGVVEYSTLVDAHLDLNPDPGNGHNKSNLLWSAGKGMLEGKGYRTFTKPNAYAASCAADLLCK